MKLPHPKILSFQFLQTLRMQNCSERTILYRKYLHRRFINWCQERSIECMSEVTPEIMTAYRRSLFYYRNPRTGDAIKFDTQAHYLMGIQRWFAWMQGQALIEVDPSADIELPKSQERLPMHILNADQVELLLNVPDIKTSLGMRNRAMIETLYSTAMRAGELTNLDVYDINSERQIVTIRLGKGKKDRVVPIGERALSWLEKYTLDVRPDLVNASSTQSLFVSKNGRRLAANYLSAVVKGYMNSAGIDVRGSCHLLRHTAATLMMEAGADLRALQQYLGHSRLDTTQIYTHVSIKRLQEVHRKTHPATPNDSAHDSAAPKEKKEDESSTDKAPKDDA